MSKRKNTSSAFELAPQIQAVIILDSNGNRLCAKYYSSLKQFKTKDSQTKFEAAVLAKANRSVQRSDSDVLLYNDHLVLYISSSNVKIFIIASSSANELVIDSVLRGLESALNSLLKGSIDARGIVDNMDYVLLAMDELCEDGIIFETSGDDIAHRVVMNSTAGGAVNQETLYEAYQKARDQWLR